MYASSRNDTCIHCVSPLTNCGWTDLYTVYTKYSFVMQAWVFVRLFMLKLTVLAVVYLDGTYMCKYRLQGVKRLQSC